MARRRSQCGNSRPRRGPRRGGFIPIGFKCQLSSVTVVWMVRAVCATVIVCTGSAHVKNAPPTSAAGVAGVKSAAVDIDRPEQHDIDQAAQAIFRSVLPPSWPPHEEKPDYYVDYGVKIFEGGKITGLEFRVQLKGKREARTSKGRISFPVEKKHLAYWVEKCPLPVFLVVVDTTAKQAWYLFVQGYAADLPRTAWAGRGKVTLHVPEANVLSDTGRLRQAVGEACQFVRVRRGGTLREAVEAERQRIMRVDPRFHAEFQTRDGLLGYALYARPGTDAEFRLQAEGPAGQRLNDAIDRGLKLRLNPGEFKLTGSPLFDGDEGMTLECDLGFSAAGTARVWTVDEAGAEIHQVTDVVGTFTGGRKEVRFSGSLADGPLTFEMTFSYAEEGQGPEVSSDFSFHGTRWNGQRILDLAYFDQLHTLLCGSEGARELRVALYHKGQRVISGAAPFTRDGVLGDTAHYLSVVQMAREVARRTGLNPEFRAAITPQQRDDIAYLYTLLGGEAPHRITFHLRLVAEFSRQAAEGFIGADAESDVVFQFDAARDFLGERVDLGPTWLAVDRARRVTPTEEIRQRMREASVTTVSVAWEVSPESVLRVFDHRPSDAEA